MSTLPDLSFAEWMRHALYDPQEGYYASGKARVGTENADFVTSVHSSAFARLLTWQFVEMWECMGSPAVFDLVEQGAHDGTFADGVLKIVEREYPDFFKALRYVIVEPSMVWKKYQQERLSSEKVRWIEKIEPFEGVHFSNELLDAFPVHLVCKSDAGWQEVYVIDGKPELRTITSQALRERAEALPLDLPIGYRTEINLEVSDWICETAGALRRGFILLADYGRDRISYYEPSRREGTLRGFKKHRRITKLEELLQQPGDCDITSDVEFTSLEECAVEQGLTLLGNTDQHHFLIGVGVPEFMRLEADADKSEIQKFLRSYQALTHPATMGSSFYFLGFEKNVKRTKPLRGFSFSSMKEV